MKITPEFYAIGVWCLFAAVIAVAQDRAHAPGPVFAQKTIAQNSALPAPMGDMSMGMVVTGRSAAKESHNPYGDLFIDPSLDNGAPVYTGPKPTSADLTAK